ncbi:MAG: CRTAC1 family protein [Planctomycetota bacterium]|nr:CRTAC1 family protein [Planctomycetota bacterium]
MLPALLALALPVVASEEPAPRSCVIYVRTADDWAPLCAGPVDREIVPLNSRSELVPCAAITKDGILLSLWAGDVPIEGLDRIEVVAVEHALDEIVVAVENERWILGPARTPRAAHRGSAAGEDVLPLVARMDANSLQLEDLWLPAIDSASGLTRWAILAESIEAPRAHGESRILRTPTAWRGRSNALRLDSTPRPSVAIDRVLEAAGRPIRAQDPVALRLTGADVSSASVRSWEPWHGAGPAWPDLAAPASPATDVTAALVGADDLRVGVARGALVEARFEAPPPAASGRSWSLLVSVHGSGAWPGIADAPRGARTTPKSAPLFVDASRELGIEMVHFEGPDLQLDIRPTMGPGAAWGDVDGDGWVDLFLPQGGGREGSEQPKSRFYRNDKGQRFVDESAARGLALTGAGMGALFYDADGDGDLDLFVANYGRNRFLVNDGAGKFSDASAAVGLDTDLWHAAVSAADYDQDGDLDLYVTSYLRYDTSAMPGDEELGRYQREDPVEMLPFAFPGERKLLLRCDPARTTEAAAGATPLAIRYTDAAKELGLDDPAGRGMQALWWDFDRDGDQDLVLANDVSPNRFWRNEGGGTFKDVGFSTGLDDPRGSMGFSAGDVDGDLDEDLFLTNWQLESNALYVNNLRHTSAKSRVSTFRDRAVEAGLGQLSVGVTSWGCELADFDLDGDLDLFYANGYTSPDYESTGICVGQPCHYFTNDGAGNFAAAFEKAGPDAAIPLASRAAVACDFDQDGDLDVAVTANNGRFRLLRNDAPRGKNHWLGVRLKGAGGNTRAIGAQVVVEAGDKKLLRSMRAGTGYLSGNAPELHFGLGEAASVTACTVRWPSGRETTHVVKSVDRFVTFTEPQ